MRDARLFQAFFAAVASDGWQIGVEEQRRMRVLFATRHQWDLATVRVALRSLLVHDPHRRAAFDRLFAQFFSAEGLAERITADQLRGVLDDLRQLPADEPEPEPAPPPVSAPPPVAPLPPPEPPVRRPRRERLRAVLRSRKLRVACALALLVVLGVVLVPRRQPLTPLPVTQQYEGQLPIFEPPVIVFQQPAEGDSAAQEVQLSNPSDSASYVIESLTGAASDDSGVVLSVKDAAALQRLPPRYAWKFTVAVRASRWEGWTGRAEAKVQGIDQPIVLSVFAESAPDWTPEPWGDLAAAGGEVVDRPLTDRRWLGWLAGALVCLAVGGGFLIWLARWRRLDLAPLPTPRPDAHGQGFSLAAIGGARPSAVREKRTRRLADMLGLVPTGQSTRRLNLPRTVERTIRAGGFPVFVWQPDRLTRRVLILEDALLDPACATGAIDDLQRGLEQTGVEVERAWFRNGVSRFADARGVARALQELYPLRRSYLVLIHTDGSGFPRPADRESLWALAKWPAAALLDPRSRDRSGPAADPLAGVPLARFRADEDGISRAFRSFAGRWRTSRPLPARGAPRPRHAQAALADDAEREVAMALGDSLLWAADCVWLQPCSRALADALRRQFHEELPPERWQRLVDLPGTRTDADGIRFGTRTRNALRAIWQRRREADDRRKVLDFITAQLDEAEPAERDTVGHLVWEAVRERFLLESEPKHSPRRLAELNQLVGPYIQESLHDFCVGPRPAGDQRTVLHTACDDPKSRQYLAAISDRLGIPLRDRLPVARWQRAVLGTLAVLAAVCLLGTAVTWLRPRTESITLPGEPRPWSKFVYLPPGTFLMGSPENEPGRDDDERQHPVTLTRGFYLAATEVTQRQYQDVMGENPSRFKEAGLDAPVENVTWDDAVKFCKRLTQREREAGRLPAGWEYRLPTEAQWEYACRAGATKPFGVGDGMNLDSTLANFDGNYPYGNAAKGPYLERTETVGKYSPNRWKFHDMHGNVWEWCLDWYGAYPEAKSAVDPSGPDAGSIRVVRGGSWHDFGQGCRSAYRYRYSPAGRHSLLGFRVAAVRVERKSSTPDASPRYEGERAIEMVKFGDLEFVRLPPGEFTMGSPETEDNRSRDETQHRVRISHAFYLARHEVTQEQWQRVMGTTLKEQIDKSVISRTRGEGPNFPVYCVNWDEAIAYCEKLTAQHRREKWLPDGFAYSLPTEAQWEYACRAGSTKPFGIGDGMNIDSKLANFDGNFPYGNAEKGPYLERTEAVGKYPPNRWKLYDMHGNVWEWCWDWYDEYAAGGVAIDPSGPDAGSGRVVRGGSWNYDGRGCRSAGRGRYLPAYRDGYLGFRVAAVRDIELQARQGRQPAERGR